MFGKKERPQSDFSPYQDDISAVYAAGKEAGAAPNLQPVPDNLVTNQPQPQPKHDDGACSGTCEVSWKPTKISGN